MKRMRLRSPGCSRLRLVSTILAAAAVAVLPGARTGAEQRSARRPNIIYILLDDAGFSDTAPYGSEIDTPNIARLASEGIRYRSFENRALCSPTRAALLTGRNSFTLGMAGLATTDLNVPHTRAIRQRGAIRDQFVEVEGITPTALDIAGVKPPAVVGGVTQLSMAGRSIRATLSDGRAKTRGTQILMLGTSRALRSNGWKAVSTHEPGTRFETDTWELFHTDVDYSEVKDLATQYPDKLRQLQALWQSEAERLGAVPLVESRGRGGEGNSEAAEVRRFALGPDGTRQSHAHRAPVQARDGPPVGVR